MNAHELVNRIGRGHTREVLTWLEDYSLQQYPHSVCSTRHCCTQQDKDLRNEVWDLAQELKVEVALR
jgi:hypothetical protein